MTPNYAIGSLEEARAYLAHPVLDRFYDGEADPQTDRLLSRV